MLDATLKAALAYLIGTIMGGGIVGKLRAVDLRAQGSGNIGATNALRTQGPVFALAVLLIDAGKGVFAALAVPNLAPLGAPALGREAMGCLCGAAAALGHCYPVWSRFRGGKGVATLAGVFGALMPGAFLAMFTGFVLVVLLSGYVSLASFTAALLALLHAACVDPHGLWSAQGAFALAMATLVAFKHRHNFAAIRRGREHRFEKARVLGRALDRWLRR